MVAVITETSRKLAAEDSSSFRSWRSNDKTFEVRLVILIAFMDPRMEEVTAIFTDVSACTVVKDKYQSCTNPCFELVNPSDLKLGGVASGYNG